MLERLKDAVRGVPWLHRLLRGRAIRAQQELEAAHHAALEQFREGFPFVAVATH